MTRYLAALALLSPMAVAQSATYAAAVYYKTKPGVSADQDKAFQAVSEKGVVALLGARRNTTGFVRLTRVFPTRPDIDHDGFYFYTRSAPPDFTPTPEEFYRAMGLTQEQWVARRDATRQTIRTEIWTNIFKHGSLNKGDFVQVRFTNPPDGKTADYLDVIRTYESDMRAELVKSGANKGQELWQLWGTEQEAPYNFLNFVIYPDAAGLFKSWGNRPAMFAKVHPGKSYSRFTEKYAEASNVSKYIVYRVDAAIWK